MSGWDEAPITSANLALQSDPEFRDDIDLTDPTQLSMADLQKRFSTFLREHKSEDGSSFPYRISLKTNYEESVSFLIVNMADLQSFDAPLFDALCDRPSELMPIFESAALQVARAQVGLPLESTDPTEQKHSFQIQLRGYPNVTPIRALSANHVNKLVTLRGIIVSASRPGMKATVIRLQCRNCHMTKDIQGRSGFGGFTLPRQCDSQPSQRNALLQGAKCPQDPYMILQDECTLIDQQRLKLQEAPERVSTGELPRHISLAAERSLVGSVKPGTRVTMIGMYTTYESSAKHERSVTSGEVGIRIPYVKLYGIEEDADNLSGSHDSMLDDDQADFTSISQDDKLYERMSQSMCPAIFDNEDTKNIKKALVLQLFGGSSKQLPDGMRLRGDINILLLGDPSVAKSQFLKFASSVAPIGVYTSGKGSSAAGLTASVIRDPGSGEFHLEGGALVLADGGLVCIDEFDKMRENDRVAIHEAMEQQTISIAKAGITTILNSRTAVCAAANPVFGRYDDMRSASENIDFQTSILSRFDLIFIIKDVANEQRDTQLAQHILDIHRKGNEKLREQLNEHKIFSIPFLRRYIAHARRTVKPVLSDEAKGVLKDQYVQFRRRATDNKNSNTNSGSGGIPITVRQLEAIIRLSEALAKMELKEEVNVQHVTEALRLFQVSTFRAAGGSGTSPLDIASTDFDRKIRAAEDFMLTRVPIGGRISTIELRKYCRDKQYADVVIDRALQNLAQRKQVLMEKQGKLVHRVSGK